MAALRKYKKIKIRCPDDDEEDNYVFVPVVTEIAFVDPVKNYQEYRYTFENSQESETTREVHTHTVENPDTEDEIEVERIDKFSVKDLPMFPRGQEFRWELKNEDPPPRQPPDDTSPPQHWETHVRRYSRNDMWVDVEMIDEIRVIDPVNKYQEYRFKLEWPNGPIDTDDLEEIEQEPPYRLDPFQNIINIRCTSETDNQCRCQQGNSFMDYSPVVQLGQVNEPGPPPSAIHGKWCCMEEFGLADSLGQAQAYWEGRAQESMANMAPGASLLSYWTGSEGSSTMWAKTIGPGLEGCPSCWQGTMNTDGTTTWSLVVILPTCIALGEDTICAGYDWQNHPPPETLPPNDDGNPDIQIFTNPTA